MSVLVVEIHPDGMLFGADRNITRRQTYPANPAWIGERSSQYQRKKVLRWPNRRALVGYVGNAQLGGQNTDDWLYEFIGRNVDFQSIEELATRLHKEIESAYAGVIGEEEVLIVHLGGFEKREGYWVPVVYWIRNYGNRDDEGRYIEISKTFKCAEEFWVNPLVNAARNTPSTIRNWLRQLAASYQPFWFRQGSDFPVINTIMEGTVSIFRSIFAQRPEAAPQTLEDWIRMLEMKILSVGAYYEAFRNPGERLIGGGADVEFIRWPEVEAVELPNPLGG